MPALDDLLARGDAERHHVARRILDRAERCTARCSPTPGARASAAGVAWPADGALRSVTLAVSLVFIAAPLAAVAALVLLTLLPRRGRGGADVEALWPLEEMRAAYT